MKKNVKTILIVAVVFIGFILLDTLQARFFKHSPLLSREEKLADDDSWVDRGILIDTYYCTREQDIITISWKFKGNKYTCPIDNIQIKKFINYDFSVTVNSNTKYEKKFAFTHNEIDYYYGNTNFELSLFENKHEYNIEVSLKNELVTFDDILSKAKKTELDKNSENKLYKYDNFSIIVCNTTTGNNDVIIGDSEMQIKDSCQ